MEEFVWCEKYRPQKIDDCVLPQRIKEKAHSYVSDGKVPTLLFSGGAGVGKTTLARCIANEMDADLMYINASLENGIDTIRTKIMQYASTISFSSANKITLLDEADFLTPSAQASLRGFIETFSSNHSFIMTCNYKSKLIEPLHSRSQIIDFKISSSEKPELAQQFYKRVKGILTSEGIEFDSRVVQEVVATYFPDFRRCLNELQKYEAAGRIDSSILSELSDETFKPLVAALKNKKFNDMRKWVANHSDMEPNAIFRKFYDSASDRMETRSIPALILLISNYQYKSAFVADQEINTTAFLTEVMLSTDIVWK